MLTYSTAGLLFPAISLLMLAYTNRFLGLASLIRQLIAEYRHEHDARLEGQIENLKQRLFLLRHAQGMGVLSLFFCTVSLFMLFWQCERWAYWCFGSALLLMLVSLVFSLREIYVSTQALNIELESALLNLSKHKK